MHHLKKAVVVAFFTTIATSLNAQNKTQTDNDLIGRAQGAASECLQSYRGSFYEISSAIDLTGICFIDGFLKRVTFYAGPNCHGTQPCPDFPTRPVAYVDFDCSGAILGVTCL